MAQPTQDVSAAGAKPVNEVNAPKAKKPRDPRLDFFRGCAMFIILLAHTPGNTWALWIPARFGFSDGADLFVFCSGMASALAFGAIFTNRAWWLGAVRIVHRMWQVYWAHIGIFLVTAIMLFIFDHYDLGDPERTYITGPYVVPLFDNTGEALIGLFTLTYVPGLFDILPMYIVILGMIPFLMLIHRAGGTPAVLASMFLLWLASNLAGYAFRIDRMAEPVMLNGFQQVLYGVGQTFSFLNLPSNPWGEGRWFFNPFAWQLIFFSGYVLGMKWVKAPPRSSRLFWICVAYVVLVIPFAWFKIHRGLYLPDDWLIQNAIADTREAIRPLWLKPDQGALRYLHFMATAYIAWYLVGPRGIRLSDGFDAPGAARTGTLILAAVVVVLTIPYTYIDMVRVGLPPVDRFFGWLLGPGAISVLGTDLFVPVDRIGVFQLLNLIGSVVLIWAAIGSKWRHWMTHDLVGHVVPVVRKVGTQSLACFMLSIPLSRFNGFLLDIVGREPITWWAVNLWGIAVLIGCAYFVGWLKGQPWRGQPTPPAAKPAPASPRGALA